MRIEERNGAIDICRFIYCLIIVGFHFYEETYEHFAMGYTGVEFFAIVSGLFFFRGWEKNKTIQKVPLLEFFVYIWRHVSLTMSFFLRNRCGKEIGRTMGEVC